MTGEWIAAIAIMSIFGWIPLKVVLGHIARMAEIKNKSEGDKSEMARQMVEMQNELKALRETTTRFDVSFDAALTRLEERVMSMETEKIRTNYDLTESPEQAALKMRH
ncbi:MAG: hypothetical protein QM758_29470 [Armatimonas sp.]